MARNRGPVVRRSRRLGMALDPKSERLLDRRPYAPGQHGKTQRPRKMLGYALQMQEKQRARFMYDVLERQFRRYYERAARQPGVVGDNLLAMLERRLDNVVFRLGFAVSRRQARQIVNHGHVQVNGGKVDIASYQVADGDAIGIRERKKGPHGGIRLALEAPVSATRPAWLERDSEGLGGRVLGMPSREDLESTQINAQLIVELYSR